MKRSLIVFLILSFSQLVFAQTDSLGEYQLLANQVSLNEAEIAGKPAVRIVKDSSVTKVDEPTFAKIMGSDFRNGIIEVTVLSKLLKDAPEFARGFIGIAYRISEDNNTYESIYIRPANARSEDQLRRNHSIQYYAYPDYKFDRLRRELPEQFEAYSDMELNRWITLRIEVSERQARLYIDKREQPSMIIKAPEPVALKSGAIGLWVDVGTEGFFADLKIMKAE